MLTGWPDGAEMADSTRSAESGPSGPTRFMAFMAMPANAEMEHVYDRVIKPDPEGLGLTCCNPSRKLSIDEKVDAVD